MSCNKEINKINCSKCTYFIEHVDRYFVRREFCLVTVRDWLGHDLDTLLARLK